MNLHTIPASRSTDPGNSHAAGASMVMTAATHRSQIWAALHRCGPMGRYEIAEVTGLDPVAVARRLSELVGQGLCRRSKTRQEMTPSGRMGSVWKVAA
jgi:predicted ArsR family transcriptional regulator